MAFFRQRLQWFSEVLGSTCMSYLLMAGESTAAGIKRVIEEELEAAAAQLSQKASLNEMRPLHETRTNVKKIRAALRLVERRSPVVVQPGEQAAPGHGPQAGELSRCGDNQSR
jgi:hypothetical protein